MIVRGVLKEYCGAATEVVIPEGVRKIGNEAFQRCSRRGITAVTIPEGVTEIGNRAFQELGKLASVTLPSTLRSIGDNAFAVCTSLKALHIPDGVTTIGNGAFSYCESLVSVQLPKELTQISEGLFRMCGKLTQVNIPEGVTQIGEWAFSWCGELMELQLPEGVKTLGEQAFYECRKLKKINIPNGCELNPGAFTCCFGLADRNGLVILRDRLLNHYPGANNEAVIVIPDSVQVIENGALLGSCVRHVEMSLRCPLWKTSKESPIFQFVQVLMASSGSTISFRNADGRVVAKVILAVEGETGKGKLYGKLSLRQENHAFDFAWYDACWETLEQLPNRLQVALVRLQYPYALSQRARQNYESVVAENSAEAGKLVIDEGETELLGMLLKQKLLQREALYELVDYANRVGDPTLTAQLLTALHADTPG